MPATARTMSATFLAGSSFPPSARRNIAITPYASNYTKSPECSPLANHCHAAFDTQQPGNPDFVAQAVTAAWPEHYVGAGIFGAVYVYANCSSRKIQKTSAHALPGAKRQNR